MVDKSERLMAELRSACVKEQIVRSYHVIYAQEVVSDLAAADARIAELEAENERLKQEVEHWKTSAASWQKIANVDAEAHAAEALSRTGAVKAGLERAAEIVLAQIDSKPDWTPEQEKELRGHDPVATARSAARVAIQQCHRAILSALEPAARDTSPVVSHETVNVRDKPEGQQPVAWLTPYFENNRDGKLVPILVSAESKVTPSEDWTPLYTRPSEQAVTEAMVEAAAIAISGGRKDLWDGFDLFKRGSFRTRALHALKAAMEAGRHD